MISQLTRAIYEVIDNTEFNKDCLSKGQLDSKAWLIAEVEKLDLHLGTVFLCAGWYATLATLLFESHICVDKIRSFDTDPLCIKIADTINRPWVIDNWKFKAITCNIHDVDYKMHTWQVWSNANNRMSKSVIDYPDTIINTSCEHIADFNLWYNKIPDGKIIILQTNNFAEIEDHVNCVDNMAEFATQAPLTQVLYEGELVLEKYTRFMRIGVK